MALNRRLSTAHMCFLTESKFGGAFGGNQFTVNSRVGKFRRSSPRTRGTSRWSRLFYDEMPQKQTRVTSNRQPSITDNLPPQNQKLSKSSPWEHHYSPGDGVFSAAVCASDFSFGLIVGSLFHLPACRLPQFGFKRDRTWKARSELIQDVRQHTEDTGPFRTIRRTQNSTFA